MSWIGLFFRQWISRERQTIFFSNKSLVNKILLITFLMNSKSKESTYKMQRREERGRWGWMMNLKYSLPSVVLHTKLRNYVVYQKIDYWESKFDTYTSWFPIIEIFVKDTILSLHLHQPLYIYGADESGHICCVYTFVLSHCKSLVVKQMLNNWDHNETINYH